MPEWETAYYWPTEETLTVTKVLKMRDDGKYEAGDCWCHESCYKSEPRTGCKLFPRKGSLGRIAHFWKGTGNFTKNDCVFDFIRKNRKESHRYAQFYHDLRNWLNSDESQKILEMIEFHETTSKKYSDFIIHHQVSDRIDWQETEIIIVHKNRSRRPNTKHNLFIDLSQWTMDQLGDFEAFGKRKIIEEFQQLKHSLRKNTGRISQDSVLFQHESVRLHYFYRLTGPWISWEGTPYALKNRFTIKGNPLPSSKSGRFIGSDVSKYLNKYSAHERLSSFEKQETIRHITEHSTCSNCHDTGSQKVECHCVDVGHNSQVSCDFLSVTMSFELMSKFGVDAKCPNCFRDVKRHLFRMDLENEDDGYDYQRRIRNGDFSESDLEKIIQVMDNEHNIPLDFILKPTKYLSTFGSKECSHNYNLPTLINQILNRGTGIKCKYCDNPLVNHITNNKYPRIHWWYQREPDIQILSKINEKFSINVEDLFQIVPPEWTYDEECASQCNNGIILEKCSHDKLPDRFGSSLKVTCGVQSRLPKPWKNDHFKFVNSTKSPGNIVNLYCIHCNTDLDSFEVMYPKLTDEVWTVEKIISGRESNPRAELSILECALLDSIKIPTIYDDSVE